MRPWYLYVNRKGKIPIGIAILFADSGSIKITFYCDAPWNRDKFLVTCIRSKTDLNVRKLIYRQTNGMPAARLKYCWLADLF